ncbi:Kelch repeat-containing protein [Piscinibacter sakaiensis]|uniref:Kelch repeat-containing protein n=1 Tax=Piscinibacter sakaiensis TaxID=1547922 RepID=UPI003AAFFFC8
MQANQTSNMRRTLLMGLSAGAFLNACGGGAGDDIGLQPRIIDFGADRANALVGETVRLTAVFANGSGRIEPMIGTVSSGIAVQSPPLAGPTRFRLIVRNGNAQVERELMMPVGYRNRYRVLAQSFNVARHAAVALGDGSVLAIGGSRGNFTLSNKLTRYDPATERFSDIGQLASGREYHSATVLADGRVLVVGGTISLAGFGASELIDPRSGAVTATGALQKHRQGHTATRLNDGRVLVIGGWGPGGDALGKHASAEIWDPTTGRFRLLPALMQTTRAGHTATLLNDGRVLVAGGFSGMAAYRFAERFDPATETFTAVASVHNEVRAMHGAHRLSDGSVLLLGGENASGSAASSAVLRYVPAQQRVDSAASLTAPRSIVASVLGAGDRVLLFGGADINLLATSTAESWQPDSGAAPLAAMPRTRIWHSTTMLADGRVLILGGEDHQHHFVGDALLYE